METHNTESEYHSSLPGRIMIHAPDKNLHSLLIHLLHGKDDINNKLIYAWLS